MRRLVTTAVIVSMVAGVSVPRASADLPGPSASGSVGAGGVSAGAGNGAATPISSAPGGGGGGGGGSSGCPGGYTYLPTASDGNVGQPYPGARGQAVDVFCAGTYVNTFWQGPGRGPAVAQVNPAQLAQQALASAAFPQ